MPLNRVPSPLPLPPRARGSRSNLRIDPKVCIPPRRRSAAVNGLPGGLIRHDLPGGGPLPLVPRASSTRAAAGGQEVRTAEVTAEIPLHLPDEPLLPFRE